MNRGAIGSTSRKCSNSSIKFLPSHCVRSGIKFQITADNNFLERKTSLKTFNCKKNNLKTFWNICIIYLITDFASQKILSLILFDKLICARLLLQLAVGFLDRSSFIYNFVCLRKKKRKKKENFGFCFNSNLLKFFNFTWCKIR